METKTSKPKTEKPAKGIQTLKAPKIAKQVSGSQIVGQTGQKIAIIRIRSYEDSRYTIRDTMNMLRLYKKNTCSVYMNTPVIMGMIAKIKDYVTYGEIDEETYKLLVEKRGNTKEGKLQNYFYLNNPRGGFERKGIKFSFVNKGALGYRGDKINLLIRKMVWQE